MLWLIFVGFLLTFLDICSCQQKIGRITNVPYVGLLNIYTHPEGSGQTLYSVLAGTYNPARSTYDNSFALVYPGQAVSTNFSGYEPTTMYNALYWPKQVTQVPDGVFDFKAVVHPDGSTIVGKTYGSIYISDVSNIYFPATNDIINPIQPTTYMYASVVWLQADAGSTWDIFTCRVLIDAGVAIEAQLVWLDHPVLNDMGARWSVNVLKETACDTNIVQASFNPDGVGNRNYDVLYATGIYTEKIAMFWTENTLGQWTNSEDVQAAVIDIGRQYYDIQIVDVNADGKLDLVVSVVSKTNGTIEVWEIPDDFRETWNYTHHVIATGFKDRTGSTTGRAPGVIKPFHPLAGSAGKPWFAVAGADDGRAYYLSPVSEDSSNWQYNLVTLVDYGATQVVSGIAAADVTGGGRTNVLVACHNNHYVDVFTF